MVVKTHFTHHDIAAMLADYDLGELQDFMPFSAGTVQSNLLIQTAKGQFALKYYENRSLESVRFEANLVAYIGQKGFPCSVPSKNCQGQFVSVYKGKPAVFYAYVEGQHLKMLNAKQEKQVIATAARLQTLTSAYRPGLKRFRWNYDRETCLRLVQQAADQAGTADAQEKARWFAHQLANLDLPQTLPKSVCHCDYDLSNLLFSGGDLVALLDFDDANVTYRSFDLVHLVDGWSWPPLTLDFDLEKARWIVAQYQRHRPLSATEKRHLFDVHKLQILFDGIWFFGRGHAADFYEKRKIDHLDALGHAGYYRAIFKI